MTRLCWVTIAVLLLSGLAAAQDTPSYQLHSPTAADYLDAIPAILSTAEASSDDAAEQRVIEALRTEISQSFDETQLSQLGSRKLAETMNLLDGWFPGLDMDVRLWAKMIVQSYLNETSLDLESVETFDIEDGLSVYVTPRDFDADGEPEYLLRVHLWYDIYLLASRSSDAYKVSIVPLWASPMMYYEEIAFEDYNHDGYPEWILKSYDNAGPGFCSTLRILNWRDNAFTEMIDGGATYCSPAGVGDATLAIVDTNDDRIADFAFEISITDIWQCLATDNAAFISDGLRWIAIDQDHFADTFGCHVRQAEEAMWNHEYDDAIHDYKAALQIGDEDLERVQYAQARLAVALALTGELDAARAAVADTSRSGQMGKLLTALDRALQANDDGFAVCAAAYQFIAETNAATPVDKYPFSFYIGLHALAGFAPRMLEDFPTPAQAGCDIQPLLAERQAALETSSLSLPADSLAASGLDIRQSLPGDFDGDGDEEWLVWLDLRVAPLYFDAVNGQWQVTSADILARTNLENDYEFATITLPDSNQDALIIIQWLPPDSHSFERRYVSGVSDCPDFESTTVGDLIVYRFDSETWTLVTGNIPLCEQRQLSDLFPATAQGRELHGWRWTVEEIIPTTYVWDVGQQAYLFPGEDIIGTTLAQKAGWALADIKYRFQRADYGTARALADDAINEYADDADIPPEQISAIRYYRALALERLNYPEFALEDYVTIVELDADSPWAMLAALHLEPTDSG